jgi:hypothetical protein
MSHQKRKKSGPLPKKIILKPNKNDNEEFNPANIDNTVNNNLAQPCPLYKKNISSAVGINLKIHCRRLRNLNPFFL